MLAWSDYGDAVTADGHQSGSSNMGRQHGVWTTCNILSTQLMVGGPGFFTIPGTAESPRKKKLKNCLCI